MRDLERAIPAGRFASRREAPTNPYIGRNASPPAKPTLQIANKVPGYAHVVCSKFSALVSGADCRISSINLTALQCAFLRVVLWPMECPDDYEIRGRCQATNNSTLRWHVSSKEVFMRNTKQPLSKNHARSSGGHLSPWADSSPKKRLVTYANAFPRFASPMVDRDGWERPHLKEGKAA